ncbi:hypothetical protein ATANTOWER_027159 [Ataeniobius toweri]|uniref:Cytochrome c oxidase subunit 7A1, mitochondrial n=1 Tax=Ataeniobius toweri TaxID=208326 RepID=A0ABU7AZU9_9TELE|nr:hypothetical protein [Ataeniobius toweri]
MLKIIIFPSLNATERSDITLLLLPWLQEDNGLPVHIKGGTGDVLLYRATMALTVAGNLQMFPTIISIGWSDELLTSSNRVVGTLKKAPTERDSPEKHKSHKTRK